MDLDSVASEDRWNLEPPLSIRPQVRAGELHQPDRGSRSRCIYSLGVHSIKVQAYRIRLFSLSDVASLATPLDARGWVFQNGCDRRVRIRGFVGLDRVNGGDCRDLVTLDLGATVWSSRNCFSMIWGGLICSILFVNACHSVISRLCCCLHWGLALFWEGVPLRDC